MGIFDLFKRKTPRPSDEGDGPEPDYVMAHYALRALALADPLRFLALVGSPEAGRFVEALLKDVAEKCGRPTSYEAGDVQIHTLRVHDYPCAVIEFPAPREPAEAFMVAVVAPVDVDGEPLADTLKVTGRYFTLEKGVTFTKEPRTVLAEWTDESHINYGDGPAARVVPFVAAIEKLMPRG